MSAGIQQQGTKGTELVPWRTIEIGPLCPKLSAQLKGLLIPPKKLRTLDKLHDSLSWVYLHGLITDSEYTAAGRKLINRCQLEANKAMGVFRV